jgi:ABC-type Zn uptake system ZnuABC Zn-binding protein ZnuA
MRRFLTALVAIPVFAAAFAGCTSILNSSGTPGSSAGPAEIVTGGYPEFYLADRIAGGTHTVVLLGKPGASVHAFDPDPSDIATMKAAKLVLLHGMSLEQWGDKAKAAMGTGGPVFNVTAPSPASLGLKD